MISRAPGGRRRRACPPSSRSSSARPLPHGLAHGEGRADAADGPACQWDYPNGWPPLAWITAEGLWRYGYREDARRVAGKFRGAVAGQFARTGQPWEKTDVETGEIAGGEYPAQPMLGWTAGVYLACGELLARQDPPDHATR